MRYILASTKELLREQSLQNLKNQAQKSSYAIDKKINKKLFWLVMKSKSKRVLAYLPLPIEADIMPTIKKLRAKTIKVFVPFVQDISFKMVPFRLPLKQGRFNLKSAGNSHSYIKNIDIALIPTVAIDANFKRIGFGKGMYDRFFSLFSVPFVVFVQRIANIGNSVISNHLDSSADILISAQSNYIQGHKKNDSRNIGIFSRSSVGSHRVYRCEKNRPSQVRYLCRAIQVKSESDRA
jgi:5-formyltetrahydrofolate cyclo-ligase